jgi:solute:Na+ symporter, SSS family
MSLYVWLLAVFVAVQIGVGLWIGRRLRGASDFFVAGRRLPAPLVFATFLAANIGAGSTIGAASLGYRIGLGGWWWNTSAGIGSLVFAAWAGPRLWTIARDRGFLTLGDFLESRYDGSVRGVSGVIIWFISLSILAGQLLGATSILEVVAGFPRWAGALAAALVVVIYFVAGGLLTSAWVNLVQLAVKLVGFLAAVPIALALVGGWSGLSRAPSLPEGYLSFTGGDGSPLWFIALLAPAFIVSPGLVQKAYGARSARAVRIGVGANAVALVAFAVVPVTLGMVARVLHPTLASPDQALPTLLAADLPPLVGALTLAAVFSAEVSAADAVLFMLSTSLSQDLYRRFIAPAADDERLLAVARASALVAGAAGLGMALVLPTVVDALKIFYSLLTVALFVPVVAGLIWPRPGTGAALVSIAAGTPLTLAIHLATAGSGLHGWPPVAVGLVVSATSFAVTALFTRPA